MSGRIVEVASDGRHLAVDRGHMVVKAEGEPPQRVPLDDIDVLIANAHGLTYSNTLLVKLAERGAMVVLCGPHHRPVGWLWPLDGHHLQAGRMAAQLDAKRPLAKRLWQELVRAKITMQGAVLEAAGAPSGAFAKLARDVRSGDPDNLEAQAARRYWPLLMGTDFRRDKGGTGAGNALLNYGYAILRALTARAVMAAGLHPSIGLFHRNASNPMCLVDDLMEPFRPLVDTAVRGLVVDGADQLDADAKRRLAGTARLTLRVGEDSSDMDGCLHRLTGSLVTAFETGKPVLVLPHPPTPLELAPLLAPPC